MSNPVNRLESQNVPSTYYTASLSSQAQGIELVQISQLSYTNVKIRGNIDLETIPVSGSSRISANTSRNIVPYNDIYAPQNFGFLILSSTVVTTLGRADLSPEATIQTITFVSDNNPQSKPAVTSSLKSSANIDNKERFQTFIVHQIEQRDLGQTSLYELNDPYVEPDIIEKDPTLIIEKRPEDLVISSEFVLATSIFSMDGVIEPLTIRSLVDNTAIDAPQVARSVYAALSITDEKRRSYLLSDTQDLRQRDQNFNIAPFLDSVNTFGNLDQPGAFSDSGEVIFSFVDTSKAEAAYLVGVLDEQMRNLFLSGVTSGTTQYFTPSIDYFSSYEVTGRHGFIFSQNNNYGYDSMAFGGLKK